MFLNTKQIVENNDKDICVYVKHVTQKNFPYINDCTLYSWHNGKRIWEVNNGTDFSSIPKDGDICKFCGREILIIEE